MNSHVNADAPNDRSDGESPEGNIRRIPKTKDAMAVALSGGKPGSGAAPSVVAGGRGRLAEQILQIAFANGIKVREDADLAQLLTAEGFVGPRGGSPKNRSREHLARLLTDYRRSREQACAAKRRVDDEAAVPSPVRQRVGAAPALGDVPGLPEGVPPDLGDLDGPPVRLHPACVTVRS